ncbi:MAG: phosphoenolpyruvate carboxykinase (ATP), partial [Nitratireductor sp.]
MKQTGPYISKHGAEQSGFKNLAAAHWNYRPAALYEEGIRRGEGEIAANGPFVVKTGVHTGRSAKDKFIVRDASTEKTVWWDNNKSMTPEAFDLLHADMLKHAEGKELFIQDLFGGADQTHRLATRVYTEYAWHSLFIQNLLIEPKSEELADFNPQFTIIDLPSFEAEPEKYGVRSGTVIACNFAKRIVLIAGTSYAGEIKKSVFSMLNYDLPPKRVMPMHCSANVGDAGDTAIFFGLSGTGKTTLSAVATRTLIGD